MRTLSKPDDKKRHASRLEPARVRAAERLLTEQELLAAVRGDDAERLAQALVAAKHDPAPAAHQGVHVKAGRKGRHFPKLG